MARANFEDLRPLTPLIWILAAILVWLLLATPAHAISADLLIAILECESSGYHNDPKIPGEMLCGDGGYFLRHSAIPGTDIQVSRWISREEEVCA